MSVVQPTAEQLEGYAVGGLREPAHQVSPRAVRYWVCLLYTSPSPRD